MSAWWLVGDCCLWRVSAPGVTKSGRMRKKLFRRRAPVHTVQCMCVPPWPVPWATWHSAELTHATRVASHRARAQVTQYSPPAADGDWSTQRLCFPAGCLKPTAMNTLLQCNLGTHHSVVSAAIASGSYVQARSVQGTCAKNTLVRLGESTRPDP